jgi:hypothetical protein
MRSVISPLIINSGFLGNHENVFPNTNIEFYVSVINQGEHYAVIEVSIEILDASSQPLTDWLRPRRSRLALAPQEAQTLLFQICVPEQAWSHSYQFDLVIDSPEHYPEYTPLHYPHVLVVRSPLLVTERGKDPSFSLNPVTTSTNPRIINPGETFEIEVLIDNSSYLVDRFHVLCRDLNIDFYSIHYPEIRDQYGLIVETNGLELNPGCQGTAKIKIHPPLSAAAGKYFPTISLHSTNDTQTNFLDILYFNIPEVHDLSAEFEDIVNRIKNPKKEAGRYQLALRNQGNTQRTLQIAPSNMGWGKLDLALDRDLLHLQPGIIEKLNLTAKPVGKWWNRPFYGIGKTFKFRIELEDLQNAPISDELLDQLTGELVWEPYPRNWFRLVIALLIILGIATAVGLGFLVWNLFFRRPHAPKIISFDSERKIYRQEDKSVIRLKWQILNVKDLRKITITQKFNNGAGEISTYQIYEFRDGKIPSELLLRSPNQADNFCEYQKQQQEKLLVCQAITTLASQPGNYQFELQAFDSTTSRVAVATQETGTIQIQAASVPNISELTSSRANYAASSSRPDSKKNSILLNWEISNPSQIKQLRLSSFFVIGTVAQPAVTFNLEEGTLPSQLKPFCQLGETLICRNFPTGVSTAGLYVFRLAVVTKQDQDNPGLTRATETIEIKPRENSQSPSPLGQPRSGNQPNTPTMGSAPPGSTSANPSARPRPNIQQLLRDAKLLTRGLNSAKQRNLPDPNGRDWRGMETAISSLRAGLPREEAARRAGVSLKSINDLIQLGSDPKLSPPTSIPGQTDDPQQLQPAPEPVWGSGGNPLGGETGSPANP